MLRQVAEGVLVHQSELLQNNAVVVQRIDCPACLNGNYSSSPKKASATGRPDRDPLAGLACTPVLPTS
jgi:hypothetical protein